MRKSLQETPLGEINTSPSPERRVEIKNLVEQLRTQGWVELQPPQTDPEIRLIAACRFLTNPDKKQAARATKEQTQAGYLWHGFTEGFIIDLIAETPLHSGMFVPVGHSDTKIVHSSDQVKYAWADGDQAIDRALLKRWGVNPLPAPLEKALTRSDEEWMINGIDLTEKWRNKGMGKLLIGLQLELLRQKNIQTLTAAEISRDLSRTIKALPVLKNEMTLAAIPEEIINSFIRPFLPTPTRPSTAGTSTPE